MLTVTVSSAQQSIIFITLHSSTVTLFASIVSRHGEMKLLPLGSIHGGFTRGEEGGKEIVMAVALLARRLIQPQGIMSMDEEGEKLRESWRGSPARTAWSRGWAHNKLLCSPDLRFWRLTFLGNLSSYILRGMNAREPLTIPCMKTA